ncbi:MAG: type 4a pilus biogenesis protein PilO [Proteobacteria bacterium]|nr:type 4a pilus biogenesis protein PilO [Pseudomonadota bacterium]
MKRKGIIFILFFLINLLFWFVFLPSKQNQLDRLISEYSALRNKIKNEGLSGFEYIYRMKEEVGEFEKRLRTSKDFPKLISYLFEQTYFAKIDLMNITYSFEEKKDVKLQKVMLNITVDGTYEGIRKYIHTLERGSHFVEINGIKLTKKPPLVSANLLIHTYLKEEN